MTLKPNSFAWIEKIHNKRGISVQLKVNQQKESSIFVPYCMYIEGLAIIGLCYHLIARACISNILFRNLKKIENAYFEQSE